MYLHTHHISRHGGKISEIRLECMHFPDEVPEAMFHMAMAMAAQSLSDSAPPGAAVNGNAIDGYLGTWTTQDPCGHEDSLHINLFLGHESCSAESVLAADNSLAAMAVS